MSSVRRNPFCGVDPPGVKMEVLSIWMEMTCSVWLSLLNSGVGASVVPRKEEYY